MSLSIGFAQNDFVSTNIKHIPYIIKGYFFFQFIESNERLSRFLGKYLKSRNIKDYRFLLCHLASIYLRFSNYYETDLNKIESTLTIDPKLIQVINFINTFALEIPKDIELINKDIFTNFSDVEKYDFDFKIFRNFPLFKEKYNVFHFLSLNFFGDTLFNNLKFDFKNFIEQESMKSDSLFDLLNYFSREFTEKYLFRRIMLPIFENNCDFLKAGKDKSDEYPEYGDYYIRIGNNILLFECKDNIVSANIKTSYQSIKIKEILIKKLASDKQGIIQLIKVIDNLSKDQINFDVYTKANKDKLKVYPILIYTDSILDTNGVNHFMNEQLLKLKIKYNYPFDLKNLIMINLDFLISHKSFFNKFITQFIEVLEIYSDLLQREIIPTKFDPSNFYPTFEEVFKDYLPNELDDINNLQDKEFNDIMNNIMSSENCNFYN
ncbi:MAG: hypothetical protein WAT71_06655 [Ignavibacteria bacterium]